VKKKKWLAYKLFYFIYLYICTVAVNTFETTSGLLLDSA